MPRHRIRIAGKLDLPAINEVVGLALATWDTTDRVKRLALPVYHYRREDLDHMWLLAAEDPGGSLLAVAALEEADDEEIPVPGHGALLHGIYVRPSAMGEGIGGSFIDGERRHLQRAWLRRFTGQISPAVQGFL